MTVVLVALAGAAGVLVRYGATQSLGATVAPWSVVAINIAGSFLLGLLAGLGVGEDARLIAGVGFLGGFTTFSTFTLDVFADLEAGRPGRAAAIAALSVVFGVGAAGLGWVVGRA